MPVFCNHTPHADGLSTIDKAFQDAGKAEARLRRTCREYMPGKMFLAADHELADLLPAAHDGDIAAIQNLNLMLPGVIYEMPAIRHHMVELSQIAFRERDAGKAAAARMDLKRIACPVGADRESLPIGLNVILAMHFVAYDFYMLREIYKRERREFGIEIDAISSAMKKAFPDIPPNWIDKLCCDAARTLALAAQRTGELCDQKGRGILDAWQRLHRGGYFDKHQGAIADIRDAAAAVELPY